MVQKPDHVYHPETGAILYCSERSYEYCERHCLVGYAGFHGYNAICIHCAEIVHEEGFDD